MSPYARRMTAALAVGATIAAGGAIAHPAPAKAPRPVPDVVAPGGNITAVVRATQRLGWPHAPQRAEERAVTRLALWYGVTRSGDLGQAGCRFGPAMGRARCRIHKIARTGTRVRFDLIFYVYEDGSYTVTPRSVTP